MLKKKILKACIVAAMLIFQITTLAACGTPPQTDTAEAKLESHRRNQADDVMPEDHAGTYIQLFQSDYPEMCITKIRWQTIPSGSETYIIEGNDGSRKCIVKYLTENQMVLGRVERELLYEEMENDIPVEKELDLSYILSITELCEAARTELVGDIPREESLDTVQELRVSWEEASPTAYVEICMENHEIRGIWLDAVTGEIL